MRILLPILIGCGIGQLLYWLATAAPKRHELTQQYRLKMIRDFAAALDTRGTNRSRILHKLLEQAGGRIEVPLTELDAPERASEVVSVEIDQKKNAIIFRNEDPAAPKKAPSKRV